MNISISCTARGQLRALRRSISVSIKLSVIERAYHQATSTNSIYSRRNWVKINETTDELNTFTVSSYNILSRHYIWKQVYNYLPEHSTDWDRRFIQLTKNMKDLDTDIMCFQEMENLIYQDYWSNELSDKYDSRFIIKPKSSYWTKDSNMMDGVGIFVRKDKFEILDFRRINFSDVASNDEYFDQTEDLKERVLQRNTVALLVVLKHLHTGKKLYLTNTHLYWNPKHSDVSLLHTYILTKIIKSTLQKETNYSTDRLQKEIDANKFNIIMCGDFNSSPDSMAYHFLDKGNIDIQHNEWFQKYKYGRPLHPKLECDFKLKSAYKYLYDKKLMTKSTYTNHFKQIIDYIWYTDGSIKLLESLGDIDSNYLAKYEGFPNEDYPSDHIPIISKFEFRA